MNDFLQGAAWYIQTGWQFLTAFNLPGVNFTPAAALFFAAFVPLVLKFIRSIVGRLSPGGSVGIGFYSHSVSGPPAISDH